MSIQYQINRISDSVNSQADLIAQIQTALAGKAGGGSSNISNFTVHISVDTSELNVIPPIEINRVYMSEDVLTHSQDVFKKSDYIKVDTAQGTIFTVAINLEAEANDHTCTVAAGSNIELLLKTTISSSSQEFLLIFRLYPDADTTGSSNISVMFF